MDPDYPVNMVVGDFWYPPPACKHLYAPIVIIPQVWGESGEVQYCPWCGEETYYGARKEGIDITLIRRPIPRRPGRHRAARRTPAGGLTAAPGLC